MLRKLQLASTVDTTASTVTTVASSTDSYVAPNGNTAGAIGSAAAGSNGCGYRCSSINLGSYYCTSLMVTQMLLTHQVHQVYSKQCSGWVSTATVEDQIATAITVYNTQGFISLGILTKKALIIL